MQVTGKEETQPSTGGELRETAGGAERKTRKKRGKYPAVGLARVARDPTNLNRVFIKFYIEPDTAQPVPAGSPPPRLPIGQGVSHGEGPPERALLGEARSGGRARATGLPAFLAKAVGCAAARIAAAAK